MNVAARRAVLEAKSMNIRKTLLRASALSALALAMISVAVNPASAVSTATTTMGVSLTVTAGCTVTATAVAFPSGNLLTANITANGSVTPVCTNTTPYTVGLDQGAGTGASIAVRKMTNGAVTVTYSLYQDALFANVWGNTTGQWVSGTGTGNAQPLVVYGRVPGGQVAAPNIYTDTVNVTVTY